jgi:hypothetical protein
MSPKFMIALLAATFLAAPLASSGSAQAVVNYNSSKSNSGNITVQRTTSPPKVQTTVTPKVSAPTIAVPHH